MAFRAFDNWNSYLDNDGNLLHGKIRFCRKGTTDNIDIFDRDGNPIRNPEFTDALGRTQFQVFVNSDEDITAYFYKYVGSGEMMQTQLEFGVEEDYDPSRWAYQYSSDSLDPANRLAIDAKGAEGAATMADLRAKDPDDVASVDGVKMIWLYGYYNAGDKPPVLYVWDDAALESDDGGSVIQATSNPGPGRWKLASTELHFDVRHFGVFGQTDKYSVDFSYTSQLANCGIFVDNAGLDAWFPDNVGNMTYYLLDGTNTFSISGDIYCSDAVRFMCKTGTTGTRIQCHELHKRTPFLFDSTVQTGTSTLVADWVNISWVGGNCVGDARIGWVIDTADFSRIITGKEVVFNTNGSPSLQLDNCLVTSHKKITGNIVISNCEIRTDWFADDYDWSKLSMSGNTILLRNCKDADTYVILKNKQNEPDYGDLGEQTLTGKTLLPNSIVENAVFSGVTLQGASEIHNVSGSVIFGGSSVALNAVDSFLYNQSAATVASISIRRGSLSGSGIISHGNVYLSDVDVSATLNSTGADAEFERCRINSAVAGQYISCTGCNIDAVVTTADSDGKVDFYFGNCKFGANGRHAITATTADSQVVGMWVGNFADSVHPIQVDMTNILGSDAAHRYVYEGNHGKFLPRHPKKSLIELSFGWGYNTTPASQSSVPDPEIMLSLDSTGEIFGAIGDIRGMLMRKLHVDMPFFAIGEAVAVYSVRVAVKGDCQYGGYTDPTTFAFDGSLEVTVPNASLFNTSVFDSLLVGPPQPLPKNWVNDADYPKRAYVTFERLV